MKEKALCLRSLNGFTLQELLVVIASISFLLLNELSNLMPMISTTKFIEPQEQLNHLYTREKNHFLYAFKVFERFEYG